VTEKPVCYRALTEKPGCYVTSYMEDWLFCDLIRRSMFVRQALTEKPGYYVTSEREACFLGDF